MTPILIRTYGNIRAHRNEWAINGEFLYMNVGGATASGTDVDVSLFVLASDAGYQLTPSLEVLAGARIVNVGNTIDFQAAALPTLEADKTWSIP